MFASSSTSACSVFDVVEVVVIGRCAVSGMRGEMWLKSVIAVEFTACGVGIVASAVMLLLLSAEEAFAASLANNNCEEVLDGLFERIVAAVGVDVCIGVVDVVVGRAERDVGVEVILFILITVAKSNSPDCKPAIVAGSRYGIASSSGPKVRWR